MEVGVNGISSQLEIVYVFKAKKYSESFENILRSGHCNESFLNLKLTAWVVGSFFFKIANNIL